MEKNEIVVLLTNIKCIKSSTETGHDDVYFRIYASEGGQETDLGSVFWSNPLKMNGKGDDSAKINIPIDVNRAFVDKLRISIRDKDTRNGSESNSDNWDTLGEVIITRDSPITDSVYVVQTTGDKAARYELTYDTIKKPIPTLRIHGLYCEKDSSPVGSDLIEKVINISEDCCKAASKAIGKSPRPRAKAIAAGFKAASKVLAELAEFAEWISEALEGADEVYMQTTDGGNALDGGNFFPPPDSFEGSYEMRSLKRDIGEEPICTHVNTVIFEEEYGHYFRIPLDKGDVTIQLKERDRSTGDDFIGALTIRQADYDRLRNLGAQAEIATEYWSKDRQGAVYHICYSVGIEDWTKPPTAAGQDTDEVEPILPVEGVTYHIVNVQSDKGLFISNQNNAPYASVQQGPISEFSQFDEQQWTVEYSGATAFLVNKKLNDKVIHVNGLEAGDEAIAVTKDEENDKQRWYFEGTKDEDGSVYLVNANSAKCLRAIDAGEVTENVVQWDSGKNDDQKWSFVEVKTRQSKYPYPNPTEEYHIVNEASRKPIGNTSDLIVQDSKQPVKWKFSDIGESHYTMIDEITGKFIAVGDSDEIGEPVYASDNDASADEAKDWILYLNEDETFYIVNNKNRLYLNLAGSSGEEQASIIQYSNVETPNSKWILEPQNTYRPAEGLYNIFHKEADAKLALRRPPNNGDLIYVMDLIPKNPLQCWEIQHSVTTDDYFTFRIICRTNGAVLYNDISKGVAHLKEGIDDNDKTQLWYLKYTKNGEYSIYNYENHNSLICDAKNKGSLKIEITSKSVKNREWAFEPAEEMLPENLPKENFLYHLVNAEDGLALIAEKTGDDINRVEKVPYDLSQLWGIEYIEGERGIFRIICKSKNRILGRVDKDENYIIQSDDWNFVMNKFCWGYGGDPGYFCIINLDDENRVLEGYKELNAVTGYNTIIIKRTQHWKVEEGVKLPPYILREGVFYSIINKKTGKALWSEETGDYIRQNSIDSSNPNQQWEIQNEGGIFLLSPNSNDMVMSTHYDNVVRTNKRDTLTQRWYLEDAGDGYVHIININYNRYLCVAEGNMHDLANVINSEADGSDNQKWKFEYLVRTPENLPREEKLYHIINKESGNYLMAEENAYQVSQNSKDLFNRNQQWRVKYDGIFFKISPKSSNMVLDLHIDLDIENVIQTVRTNLNGINGQKWFFADAGDGHVHIVNSSMNKHLSIDNSKNNDGKKAILFAPNSADDQKWKFVEVMASPENLPQEGKFYSIVNKNSNKALCIDKNQMEDNGNIFQISKISEYEDQRWKVQYDRGCATIINEMSKMAICAGGAESEDNAFQMSREHDDKQRWYFEDAGDDYFYIINVNSGKYLDVSESSEAEGANVIQWQMEKNDSQKWKFEEHIKLPKEGTPYFVVNQKSGKALLADAGTNNVSQYSMESANMNQQWEIQREGDLSMLICKSSDKVLDIDGDNAIQSVKTDEPGNTGQKWILESAGSGYFHIINSSIDKCLEIQNGYTNDGDNIAIYTLNSSDLNHRWKFVQVELESESESE